MKKEIKRGEIYWVDWTPGRGSEQSGLRPALVLQNDAGNRFSPTTIVAACTTARMANYPFVVPVAKEESGLPKDCCINLSAILTIDKAHLAQKCGQLDKTLMARVDKAVKLSLGLD